MRWPESLYLLSLRDQQVTWLDPFLRRQVVSTAALQILVDEVVPEGRILVLNHAFQRGSGGSGNTTMVRLEFFPSGVGTEVIIDETLVAASQVPLRFDGEISLPPRTIIRSEMTFASAVSANTNALYLCGMLIPVGNLQRV